MESILTSIKNLLGINEECKDFDNEIIPHINTAFLALQQIGVTLSNTFMVTSDSETWEDVFGSIKYIDAIKTYTFIKVKLVFDPPSSSSILESLKQAVDTLEWRINFEVENANDETNIVDIENDVDEIIDLQESLINKE